MNIREIALSLKWFFWIIIFTFVVALACVIPSVNLSGVPTFTSTPTIAPTSTKTPKPTATPNLVATRSAKSTQAAEEIIAEIMETIDDSEIEVDLKNGFLGWVQSKPSNIELQDYAEAVYDPIGNDDIYADFILRTNVTWESSGIAFCGFMFRSEKNFEKGEQYRFSAVRFSGLPIYWIDYWKNGQWVNSLIGGAKTNDAIDLGQGATNEFILYARGDTLSVYANGIRLTDANISRLPDGHIAFQGFQEAGVTKCKFSDTWLYVIENTEAE